MEIKQLNNFSRIAELGNLTRAASVLGLTQAALSRQVAQLEAELGQALFRRNGRGVVLTEPGKRLLEHIPAILRQIAVAERAVRGPLSPLQGTLVLGLPPSLARTIVLPLIEAFKVQLPEVRLRTVDGLSANLVELVALGKLDCAVAYDQPAHESVDLYPLAEEELYLVSGPMAAKKARQRSLSLAELAELPLVISGKVNVVHTALAGALAAIGRSPNVVHEIENLTAILDLVRAGHGYSVIPMSGVHPCIGGPDLHLHRIRKPVLHCNLSIVTPKAARTDSLTDRCTSLVREVVRQQLTRFRKEVESAIDA